MKAKLLRCGVYALLLSLASCKSCKKEVNPDPLPPETQTGANTFGCLIDGQPWIPDGGGGFSQIPPISGGYISASTNVPKHSVWISTRSKDKKSISLYVRSVDKAGLYLLNFNTSSDIGGSPNSNNFGLYTIDGSTINDPDYNYITTSQYTGWVNFTVADTLTKQLSGTFEFDAIDHASGKTVKITKGRFDLNQTTR
jgi:hypothetical protein